MKKNKKIHKIKRSLVAFVLLFQPFHHLLFLIYFAACLIATPPAAIPRDAATPTPGINVVNP